MCPAACISDMRMYCAGGGSIHPDAMGSGIGGSAGAGAGYTCNAREEGPAAALSQQGAAAQVEVCREA